MDVGRHFHTRRFETNDTVALEDFYGSKGYIDVTTRPDRLRVKPDSERGHGHDGFWNS